MSAPHRPAHTRSTPAADRPDGGDGITRGGWWAITLTAGLLLILGYVLAFGPSKHWTPVPAVFLGFFLVSGFIGLVFWKGVRELRAGSPGKGGPSVGEKVSTAAAVIALVAGFSFAPTMLQQLPNAMAICPGDATCPPGPGQPTLEMPTQTPGQNNGGQNPTAGQNPGSTAGQGLPPSPTAGAPNNGDNIQAHIPDGSPTPGQQAPNVPGNEQAPTAGQAPAQQPTGQPQQTGRPQTGTRQPRVTTTPPRRDGDQTTRRRPDPDTSSSSSSSSTTPNRGWGTDRDRRGDDSEDDDEDGRGWPNAVAETASIFGTRRRISRSSTSLLDSADTRASYLRSDDIAFLRRTVDQKVKVTPGKVMSRPETGQTTGDGLPNPDPHTTYKPAQTPSQEKAYGNIESTPNPGPKRRVAKLWESLVGQENPWKPGSKITGNEDMQADHVIPKRTLANYIGFDHLSKKVQRQISDMEENLWPVPKEINEKNQDKPKSQWVDADGKPFSKEQMAMLIAKATEADKAIRQRIVDELLNDRDAVQALLEELGYSNEEISAFFNMSKDAQRAALEKMVNGQRPVLDLTKKPGDDADGTLLVPARKPFVVGKYDPELGGMIFHDGPPTPGRLLHASDYFKDGWEPPAALSKARDAALQEFWNEFVKSGNQPPYSAAYQQALFNFMEINNVYQAQVQAHWAEIGRAGAAPNVMAVCVPANVPKV